MTLIEELRQAWTDHEPDARASLALLQSWATLPVYRIPGCDTALRLAHRIRCGRSIEQAASREYLYRWHLAIVNSPIAFPPLHTLGM